MIEYSASCVTSFVDFIFTFIISLELTFKFAAFSETFFIVSIYQCLWMSHIR